jgi:hypothetical protein
MATTMINVHNAARNFLSPLRLLRRGPGVLLIKSLPLKKGLTYCGVSTERASRFRPARIFVL